MNAFVCQCGFQTGRITWHCRECGCHNDINDAACANPFESRDCPGVRPSYEAREEETEVELP